MKTSRQHLDVTSFASTVNKVGMGINKRKAENVSMKPTRQGQKMTDPFRITVKDTTLECGQSLNAPEKFKLQLFPIDDNTHRILLELNHNPYLELTLRPRKRISSVVKHLNVKWGISGKRSSELMLFPYEAQTENIVDHRKWTLKDTGTSAADVFMAIGHPEVFRLRYGWFPDVETETFQMSSPHFSSENNLQSEDEHVNANKEKQPCTLVTQEVGSVSVIDTMKSSSCKLRPSDESVKVVQNLGMGSTLLSWVDCVTNISMGQLLSETPDANLSNPLPSERNPSFKQIPMNCDSFDVAIADLIAQNQGSQSSTQMLHSSIWEAEETRHAFPNQEASSSRNGVVSVSYRSPIQDHPSEEQVADLKSDSHDPSGRVNANSQPEPQVLHSDMSNLGLSNLCWGDSLGPFEFGVSSKHINGGDTISLSGLLGNSLDAFQNSQVFGMEKVPSS